MRPPLKDRWSAWSFPAVLFVYALVRLRYLGFVPIWDARIYYQVMVSGLDRRFDPLHFCWVGHSSLLFLPLIGISHLIAPGNVYLFNAALVLLTVVGIIAFHGILSSLLPFLSEEERALGAAIFAFDPTILSNTVHFNIDHGVLVFFLVFWWMLLRNRPVPATVAAVFMLFSKETAIILFPLPLAWVFFNRRSTRRLADLAAPAIVPPLCVAAYLLYRTAYRHSGAFFRGISVGDAFALMATPLPITATVRTFAFEIFALNFAWIATAGIVLAVATACLRPARERLAPWSRFSDPSSIAFWSTAAMLTIAAYGLTRYRVFVNARYVMCATPLLLLTLFQAEALMIGSAAVRMALNGIFLALLLASNFRTLDPVSRAYFGTFQFGSHRLLRVASVTNKVCGRDELAYNLEFTRFGDIEDQILKSLRPDSNTVIGLAPGASWTSEGQNLLWGPVDAGTMRRTLRTQDVFRPRYLDVRRFAGPWPATIFYVAYPIFNTQPDINRLTRIYGPPKSMTYQRDGYAMTVFRFDRTEGAPSASSDSGDRRRRRT